MKAAALVLALAVATPTYAAPPVPVGVPVVQPAAPLPPAHRFNTLPFPGDHATPQQPGPGGSHPGHGGAGLALGLAAVGVVIVGVTLSIKANNDGAAVQLAKPF